MNAKATKVTKKKTLAKADTDVARPLPADVRKMILQTRENVARSVDSALTKLYWHVGCRVRQDILKEKRAEYGGQIVSALGRQLEKKIGSMLFERSGIRVSSYRAEALPKKELERKLHEAVRLASARFESGKD